MNENKKKYICREVKEMVLKNQQYKCANSVKDYNCLLWMINNGNFDESGYQFDHINEFCLSSDNTVNNIQALCPNCHAVKTKRFMQNRKIFSTFELDNGCGVMELDSTSPNNRSLTYISDDSDAMEVDYSNDCNVYTHKKNRNKKF